MWFCYLKWLRSIVLKCCLVFLVQKGCEVPYRKNTMLDKLYQAWVMVRLVVSSVLMNQQCILNKASLNRTGSFPGGTSGTCLQRRRHERRGFDPWVGKISCRRASPLQYSCLENAMDRGAWWATICRVAESRTWLKGRFVRMCRHKSNTHKYTFIGWWNCNWRLTRT